MKNRDVTVTEVGNQRLLDVNVVMGGGAGSGSVKITDGVQEVTVTDVAGKKALDVNIADITLDHQADSIGSFDLYQLNDLDDSTPLYVGKAKVTGVWLVERFNETTGSKDYANVSNNPSITNYGDAWTNRLTLNFLKIQLLTGV
jgi:hypothetical protein